MSEPTHEDLKRRIAELEEQLARTAAAQRETVSRLDRYRSMIDGMDVALLIANPEGVVIDVNRKAGELTGREREELVGRSQAEMVVERERARFDTEFRNVLEGALTRAGFTLRKNDGTELPVEVRFQRVESGEELLVCSFVEDVSALALRDRRRFQEAKAATAGTLCEGVAHQFNNLLARMMACAEDAGEEDLDPEVFQRLRTIVQTCQEGSRITESLLSYAGRRPMRRRPVSPVNILEHTLQMLDEELIQAGVEVTRDYGTVPELMLDNVHMVEVFTHLVRNALHAMPQGGRLHVTCHVEGEDAVVRISDTGTGMPQELLDTIFLPFVTTKGVLSGSDLPGMGLGLCACQGIVTSHGGVISAESTSGKGTTFTIRLPLEPSESGGETGGRKGEGK